MSKAILVMDMPESCRDCPIRSLSDDCQVAGRYVQEYRYNKNKPDWCPLREMPERKNGTDYLNEVYHHPAFDCGWNACLNRINQTEI